MKKSTYALIACLICFISCEDQRLIETEKEITEEHNITSVYTIEEIMQLPEYLLKHTKKLTENLTNNDYIPIVSESKLVSYYDSPIKAIYTPLTSTEKNNRSLSHVYFEKSGLVSTIELIILEEPLNDEIIRFHYQDIYGHPILMFDVAATDGKILYVESYAQNKTWFGRWRNCLQYTFNHLVDNPVDGLICMAFGKYCAGSIAALCGIAAAEGYFVEAASPN